MMELAGKGREKSEGVRMGVWGAAQGLAFGAGGLIGTVAVDVMRAALGSALLSYAAVFAAEGVLFVVCAGIAARLSDERRSKEFSDPFVAHSAQRWRHG